MEKKTIGINSLIALGLILTSMIVPTYFENPQYYCEAESSIKECPGNLSGGSATRCYLDENKSTWDYCKSGWIEVTNDLIIQEEPEEPENITKSGVGIKVWGCNQTSCERKQ